MAVDKSEIEAMEELVRQMWERYIKPRADRELLNHSLDGYKATVTANNGDGTLTVSRPFDSAAMTLRCPPTLAKEAAVGDHVLVVALGDMSNAFILCRTDLSGFSDLDPRPTEFDFSTIASDLFSVTWEGGITTNYQVERDGSDRITKITCLDDGFETVVNW